MRYLSLNSYLQSEYGEKLYKLSLDGGMTCPNRDGTLGTGGCIFCSAGGSGEFAEAMTGTVTAQIEEAKKRVAGKFKENGYIAYFQSYTNTYASVAYLEKLFMEAIAHPDVRILSVATRPDCLEPEKIALLKRLNQIKPVWVELGLQTMHEERARYIRRGYDNLVYERVLKALKEAGIEVVTHLILGLPGENCQDMIDSVKYVANVGTNGVKLQLLHVLKDTDLAVDYDNGKFEVLSLEEYAYILGQCVMHLPGNVVIHRLTGDGDKRLLLAPAWSGDKKRVLNYVNRYFESKDIVQGAYTNIPFHMQ